jgi:hypothetical protein
MDWFLVKVRVMKRCRRQWAQLLGIFFAKEDMGQWFDCLELVRGCLFDAFYGHGEVVGCLEDAICGRDFRDRNGMVFVIETIGDTFTAGVAHDDLDSSITLEGRANVPHIQCMKTPWQLPVGFMMCQYLGA